MTEEDSSALDAGLLVEEAAQKGEERTKLGDGRPDGGLTQSGPGRCPCRKRSRAERLRSGSLSAGLVALNKAVMNS